MIMFNGPLLRIILFLTPIVLQVGLASSSPLIGESVRQAEGNEFPFIVPIKLINDTNLEPESDFVCTGTIVSKWYVVSVAHGLSQLPINRFEIIVGSNDLRSRRKVRLTNFITYAMWAEYKQIALERSVNDISLIKVAKKIPSAIMPVVVSAMPLQNLYGYEVETAGWGRTNVNSPSRYLQTVSLTIMEPDECGRRIEALINQSTDVHNTFICTVSNPPGFLRRGDSGGPLLFYGQLIGINKGTCPYAEDNFHPHKVNIHTEIEFYKYFISDIINNF